MSEVFQLRDEFAPLRTQLREIEDQLRNRTLSPADAFDLENAWRHRWERLAEKLGSSNNTTLDLARTSVPLLQEGLKIVKAVSAHSAIDVIAAAVGWIGPAVGALGSLQMRPIHKSVSNYVKCSDHELKRAVARIFQHDFVRLEADMNALAQQPGNPWRLATDQHQPRLLPKSDRRSPAVNFPSRQFGTAPDVCHPSLARPPISNSTKPVPQISHHALKKRLAPPKR